MQTLVLFLACYVIPLVLVTAYVLTRDRRHPVDHPLKGNGQGWGNKWPRW